MTLVIYRVGSRYQMGSAYQAYEGHLSYDGRCCAIDWNHFAL